MESHEAKETFNPAVLTPEDIQSFVSKAIQGEAHRKYKINPAPTDRPVRIYADGEFFLQKIFPSRCSLTQFHMFLGVYDLFHFGFAILFRVKLS
jgi:hypothetical protein